MQNRLRLRASERIDGLVVVTCHDEVLRAVAPLPDQRQLQLIQVLGFVGEDHRRSFRRRVNIAVAGIDQVREVHQAVGLLVLGPHSREFPQVRRPGELRHPHAPKPAHLLQEGIAILGQAGVVLLARLLAVELAVLSRRRDGHVRVSRDSIPPRWLLRSRARRGRDSNARAACRRGRRR